MNQTDKLFWIAWVIAELLLLASCIDVAVRCQSLSMICVFALFKKTHPNAALVNAVIISLYTVYSIYLRLTHEDTDGWGWFALCVALPVVQLLLVLLYWGISKLAKVTRCND